MKHQRPPQKPNQAHAIATSGVGQWLWLALVLLAFGIALGQSACVVGAECKYDTDCPLDALCKAGRCDIKPDGGIKTGCSSDADCPNTHLCIQRACKPITTVFDGSSPDKDGGSLPDRPRPDAPGPDGPTPETPSSESAPDRPAPPPALGPTPQYHAVTSGGAVSSNKTYRHIAVIGQACPVAPSSTVTRSTNYSARVGVLSVTLW